jgi:hypothetical protein
VIFKETKPNRGITSAKLNSKKKYSDKLLYVAQTSARPKEQKKIIDRETNFGTGDDELTNPVSKLVLPKSLFLLKYYHGD